MFGVVLSSYKTVNTVFEISSLDIILSKITIKKKELPDEVKIANVISLIVALNEWFPLYVVQYNLRKL